MIESLTKQELKNLLEVAKQDSNTYFMILLAFNHGLRASEVMSLTGNSIKDNYLTVNRLKGSNRTVQKVNDSIAEFAKHKGKELLFPCNFKQPRKWFWLKMRECCRLAGIPVHKAHPHVLKHTCAMLGLQGGMKINEIQKRLGHKNGDNTLKYLEVSDNQADKAFEMAVGI